MNSRQFNGVFRPRVDRAWEAHCNRVHCDSRNLPAKDAWYRDQLLSATEGRLRSTASASAADQSLLLDLFSGLSTAGDSTDIAGWSDAQNARFAELAGRAWQRACRGDYQGNFPAWLDDLLATAGIFDRHAPDRKASFDSAMAALAVQADDSYWISRTAQASEIRIRWQISRLLRDLEFITQQPHDWAYVCGIWKQSDQLPLDIEDAPAVVLRKVLAMLDSHVRRLCRDSGLRPMDLPSRKPLASQVAMSISDASVPF